MTYIALQLKEDGKHFWFMCDRWEISGGALVIYTLEQIGPARAYAQGMWATVRVITIPDSGTLDHLP